jgi:hypothetical protein
MQPSPLAALDELERRYDGPVPPDLCRAALLGSARAVRLLHAEAQAGFFAAMIRGQIGAIRSRRVDGSVYPALYDDLALYRRERRRWRGLARRYRTEAP